MLDGEVRLHQRRSSICRDLSTTSPCMSWQKISSCGSIVANVWHSHASCSSWRRCLSEPKRDEPASMSGTWGGVSAQRQLPRRAGLEQDGQWQGFFASWMAPFSALPWWPV